MLVGATEDAVRSADPAVAQQQMDLLAAAGFRAVRITDIWAPGDSAVSTADAKILDNVVAAAKKDGLVVFVSVLNFGSKTTPLTDADQADFASYAASVVTTTHVRYVPGWFLPSPRHCAVSCRSFLPRIESARGLRLRALGFRPPRVPLGATPA